MDKATEEKLFNLSQLRWDYVLNFDDRIFSLFYDMDSEELIDEKIEVLELLIAGKTIDEIGVEKYYKILELHPKFEEEKDGIVKVTFWD